MQNLARRRTQPQFDMVRRTARGFDSRLSFVRIVIPAFFYGTFITVHRSSPGGFGDSRCFP